MVYDRNDLNPLILGMAGRINTQAYKIIFLIEEYVIYSSTFECLSKQFSQCCLLKSTKKKCYLLRYCAPGTFRVAKHLQLLQQLVLSLTRHCTIFRNAA